MTTPDVEQSQALPTGTPAAWLATATGIPIYAPVALLLMIAASRFYENTSPDGWQSLGVFALVLVVNLFTVVLGIGIVAHTLGRVVFRKTYHSPTRVAAGAFALMGAGVSLPVVVLAAATQPDAGAVLVYGLLAITTPAAITSGVTRALLPRIAAARWGKAIVYTLAGAVVIAVGAAIVMFRVSS
jgi:hypothetical protein